MHATQCVAYLLEAGEWKVMSSPDGAAANVVFLDLYATVPRLDSYRIVGYLGQHPVFNLALCTKSLIPEFDEHLPQHMMGYTMTTGSFHAFRVDREDGPSEQYGLAFDSEQQASEFYRALYDGSMRLFDLEAASLPSTAGADAASPVTSPTTADASATEGGGETSATDSQSDQQQRMLMQRRKSLIRPGTGGSPGAQAAGNSPEPADEEPSKRERAQESSSQTRSTTPVPGTTIPPKTSPPLPSTSTMLPSTTAPAAHEQQQKAEEKEELSPRGTTRIKRVDSWEENEEEDREQEPRLLRQQQQTQKRALEKSPREADANKAAAAAAATGTTTTTTTTAEASSDHTDSGKSVSAPSATNSSNGAAGTTASSRSSSAVATPRDTLSQGEPSHDPPRKRSVFEMWKERVESQQQQPPGAMAGAAGSSSSSPPRAPRSPRHPPPAPAPVLLTVETQTEESTRQAGSLELEISARRGTGSAGSSTDASVATDPVSEPSRHVGASVDACLETDPVLPVIQERIVEKIVYVPEPKAAASHEQQQQQQREDAPASSAAASNTEFAGRRPLLASIEQFPKSLLRRRFQNHPYGTNLAVLLSEIMSCTSSKLRSTASASTAVRGGMTGRFYVPIKYRKRYAIPSPFFEKYHRSPLQGNQHQDSPGNPSTRNLEEVDEDRQAVLLLRRELDELRMSGRIELQKEMARLRSSNLAAATVSATASSGAGVAATSSPKPEPATVIARRRI